MKLLLINHENPLPDNFKPCLADLFEGFQLEKHAALAMKQMLCSALKEEVHIRIFSAYRSISYQRGLFDQDMQRYIVKGMSYDEAYKKTAFSVAVPGESEHNAGLAADISSMDWKGEITADFENTPEFKWLDRNAHKFGFILRYPKGKENITGITYEPWHYRFVGKHHSCCMKRMNLTLEEYMMIQRVNCESNVNK